MSQAVQGTFATGVLASVGNVSDSVVLHSSISTLKLSTVGLDASNTLKTQKRTSPGSAWVDQTTYNSDQVNAGVTVAAGEEWRVFQVSQQTLRDVKYKLSLET